MTTTANALVEINDDGDFWLPEHLVPSIRLAAGWRVSYAADSISSTAGCGAAFSEPDDRREFRERLQALEDAIEVMRTVGLPDEPMTIAMNAATIASLASEAAEDLRYRLASLTEQSAAVAEIAETAAVAVDVEALAEQLRPWLRDDDGQEAA
jgi:hypothetical protein